MSKFKSGDKVFWMDDGQKNSRTVSHVIGEQVWFTSGKWMHEDELFFEYEDQLPEVPKEPRFDCDLSPGTDYLLVDSHTNRDNIRVVIRQDRDLSVVALSPETALALSADLLRMALKMKRKLETEDE